MATFANFTVYDGASTPVAHVMKASRQWEDKGVLYSLWKEDLPLVSDEAQVRFQLAIRVLPSKVTEIVGRLTVPVMESISGQNAQGYTAAQAVAFTDTYEVKCMRHPRSTQVSTRLARQIMANILNNVSTSVAAVSSGFLAEACDSLNQPT